MQKRKRATTAAVVVALWRKWRNGVCVLSRLSTSPFFFSILPGVNWKRYKTIKQKKVHTKTITQRVSNKKERGLDQSSNRWLTSFNSPGRQVSRVVSDAIGGPVFFKNVFFFFFFARCCGWRRVQASASSSTMNQSVLSFMRFHFVPPSLRQSSSFIKWARCSLF